MEPCETMLFHAAPYALDDERGVRTRVQPFQGFAERPDQFGFLERDLLNRLHTDHAGFQAVLFFAMREQL